MFGEARRLGLHQRGFGLGLSDLFGVGLASRTAVPLASAPLFGAKFCLSFSKRMIVRPLGDNRRAPRTIVRFNPVEPGFFGLRTSQLFGIGVAARAATHLPNNLPTPFTHLPGVNQRTIVRSLPAEPPERRKEEYFKRSQNKLI